MRRVLTALCLTLALAACQPSTPAPATGQPIAEQALPVPDTTPESAPTGSRPATETPEPAPAAVEPAAARPAPEPPMLTQERRLCERSGGRLIARSAGLYTCVRPTRDAGRTCDEASDCEGLCLARSATCAPFTPLYGCQEVFTLRGRRETLCTD